MKHLILCADGTGNLGGTTPDSNVYRTYHLIDRWNPSAFQLTYYDNGVGTASNSYWRAFTGAFGFGFKRNVLELYEFLARNYDPGDRVFLFGFSRGAAEVRALSGLIAAAGLVDGRNLEKGILDQKINEAYRHYKHKLPGLLFQSLGAIELTFIGVWDTVSALGFPQHWKVAGIVSPVFNVLFRLLDLVCDKTFFAHRFYNYELTPNVSHAYQALAIDEERLSFEPKVWKERGDGKTKIEQVWFAGAHSNVGGGYGRAGLSHIALEWMLSKAVPVGLKLRPGALEEVHAKAHAQGRLYNERNGFGVFYRYYPRFIADLCRGKIPTTTPINIHRSVFARMERFTGHYAPGHFPSRFSVVDEASPSTTVSITNPQWEALQKQLDTWTMARSWLYGIFLDVSLFAVGAAIWLWKWPPLSLGSVEIVREGAGAALHHLADILKYFLPVMFDNLINLAVVHQPLYLGGALMVMITLFIIRWWVRKKYHEVCYALRVILLAEPALKGSSFKNTLAMQVTSHEGASVPSKV
jgi:type VI secretion system (T6SS) phospholipase Tle1-like effector